MQGWIKQEELEAQIKAPRQIELRQIPSNKEPKTCVHHPQKTAKRK